MLQGLLFLCVFGDLNVSIINPPFDNYAMVNTPLTLSAFTLEPDEDYIYTWTFSNGDQITGKDAVYTPSETGVLQISLVAKDSTGAQSNPDDRIIYVRPVYSFIDQPQISRILFTERLIHPNQATTLSAEISDPQNDGPFTYHWFYKHNDRPVRAEGETFEIIFPEPNAEATSVTVSLIVEDGAGNASYPAFQNIYIYKGNLPPTTRVTQPDTSYMTVLKGTEIEFRASASDPEGNLPLTFSWYASSGETAQGTQASFQFNSLGYQTVLCTATDSLGNGDPGGPIVVINVVEPQDAIPGATIFLPFEDPRLFEEEDLILSGLASESLKKTVQGLWTITCLTDTQEHLHFEGSNPGRSRFSQQGLYFLSFDSTNDTGIASRRNDYNTRLIAVQKRDSNQPPALSTEEEILRVIPNQAPVFLEVQALDPDGQIDRFFWAVDGKLTNDTGPTSVISFDLESSDFSKGVAYRSVRVQATDNFGKPASQPLSVFFSLYESRIPPLLSLEGFEPAATYRIPVGTSFSPRPVIDNAEGLDLNYLWALRDSDNLFPVFTSEESDPGAIHLMEAGLYYLVFDVVTKDDTLRAAYSALLYIHVFDPQRKPNTIITQPSSQLRIEKGQSIRFTGTVEEPNFVQKNLATQKAEPVINVPKWSIDGQNTYYDGETVEIAFPNIGTFQVIMETANSLGLTDDTPASVVIEVVEPAPETRFEPNNTREEASTLTLGRYSGFTLSAADPIDWFQIPINEPKKTLEFDFDLQDAPSAISLSLFLEESLIQEMLLQPGKMSHITLNTIQKGTYFISFESKSLNKADGLSFGIGIGTLMPRLSFPYVKDDSTDQTMIILLNPQNETATVQLQAYSETGDLLEEISLELGPRNRREKEVSEWFPALPGSTISWISASSNVAIEGLGLTVGRDQETAVAEPAMVGGFQDLLIPHIAQRTDQWYTLGSVINTSAFATQPKFVTSEDTYQLISPKKGHQGNLFNFLDFFGGNLPPGSEWGTFSENSGTSSLAGLELFGKRDGNHQSAAISMIAPSLRNPNFTYIRRDIYFPHIAKDTASFWTGLAFVNTGSSSATGNLNAYSEGGVLLASETYHLDPYGKEVDLAHNFFPSLDESAQLGWVQLETGDPIMGFELFGSNDGTDRRLSGFPAVQGGTRKLNFLKVYEDTSIYWTGLAVVNLSTQTTSLTYTCFDDHGQALAEVGQALNSLEKRATLVKTLFGGSIPTGTTWVQVKADQSIAGFQLLGDQANKFMAGTLAQ